MRRIALVLGLAMLLAMVAAGVAVAVTKTCGDTLPCEGTNDDDVLYERIGPNKHDRIFGFDGHDVIDANTFNADRDVLLGGNQGDKLLTNDTDGRQGQRRPGPRRLLHQSGRRDQELRGG